MRPLVFEGGMYTKILSYLQDEMCGITERVPTTIAQSIGLIQKAYISVDAAFYFRRIKSLGLFSIYQTSIRQDKTSWLIVQKIIYYCLSRTDWSRIGQHFVVYVFQLIKHSPEDNQSLDRNIKLPKYTWSKR